VRLQSFLVMEEPCGTWLSSSSFQEGSHSTWPPNHFAHMEDSAARGCRGLYTSWNCGARAYLGLSQMGYLRLQGPSSSRPVSYPREEETYSVRSNVG